ncbi:MAG: dihydrofolate reductase [bacterium]|nr:dihydrofolate reductase [bacterium]
MHMKSQVSIIAAIGNGNIWNGGLGKDNKLIWHIPDDLKRFKILTTGHPIIMGRKTFESIITILGKPLPNRTNIVVTHHPESMIDFVNQSSGNVVVAGSIEEAIEKGKALDAQEMFVIGGAQIYEAALPFTDKLYLTLIDDDKEADSFFPPYEDQFTKKVFEEAREWNGLKYTWVDLGR